MKKHTVSLLLLLVVAVTAVVWFAWTSANSSVARPTAGTTDRPLLRPLAHRHDGQLQGRLRIPEVRGFMTQTTQLEHNMVAALRQAGSEALRRDDADAGAVVDLASRLLWLGHWATAEDIAMQILAAAPHDGHGKALLSAVREEQGRLAEAAVLANEALAVDPHLSFARIGRARGRAARGELEAALAELRDVSELEPEQPAATFLLGSLLANAGRFAEAASWLQRARAFLPDPAIGKGGYITTVSALAELLGGRAPYRKNREDVEVPMRLLPLPAVQGTLSGMGKTLQGWFVLDCGASLTVLGRAAAGLARESGASAAMLTVAGQTNNAAGLLQSLTIGNLVLDDVPVLVNHGEKEPHAPDVIATLGVGLLRNFRVGLDLPNERCRFEAAPGSSEPPPAADVPFQLVHNMILVPGRFGSGVERTFVFDTGANNLFVSPKVLGQEFGALPGRTRKQVAFGGAETDTIEVPLPRPFVFGGRELQLSSVIGDPSIDLRNAYLRQECAGTLGLVIRARYVLDFARQRLLLYER